MNDNLENHMVLDSPDAPWNAKEPGRWECDCGYAHAYEVKTSGGYPKWRNNGRRFVEDCAGSDCTKRCCHDCAVTCRICGCHYCPEHQKGFFKPLSLCEDCGACYTTVHGHIDAADVEKLIEIERRLASGRAYGRGNILDSERDWLIESLKEAWETLASRKV